MKVLLIISIILLLSTSKSISQIDTSRVVILDSITAVKVIKELEIKDKLEEENKDLLSFIDYLTDITYIQNERIVNKDSIIVSYEEIDSLRKVQIQNLSEMNKGCRSEKKALKRRNLLFKGLVVAEAILVLYLVITR